MSSDPRENRGDVHKPILESGTSRPADSTTPDEEQIRSLRAKLSALLSGHVVEVEEIVRRLEDLPEDLRRIVSWKLEGLTNAKIARLLGRTERTVELKLAFIRKRLAQELDPSTRSRDSVSGSPAPLIPQIEELFTSTGEWQSLPSPSFEVGQVGFNKYRLLEKIGAGGMGTVWRAWNIGRERECALKVIKAEVALDDPWWQRFTGEVRRLAAFRHPGAVAVYDIGKVGDLAYIEMEYVQGRTLRQWLEPGESLPLERVEWLLHEMCEVLGRAHELGLVHHDIKPDNIMVVPDPAAPRGERVKVLDFGIAKVIRDAASETFASLTQDSMGFLGAIPYSSPEQLGLLETEQTQGVVDHRSDIYSLGVMLYEMLVGARPFTGTQTKILYDHAHTPPPPFNEKAPGIQIHPAVEGVVLRCLNKIPDDRPQSASELSDQFREAIDEMRAHDERPLRAEIAPAVSPSSPRGAGPMGLLIRFLGKLGRSRRRRPHRSAKFPQSAAKSALETKPPEGAEPFSMRGVPATIRRRADISFPSHVLVGKAYDLSIQLVPIEGGDPGGLPSLRRLPYADDWPLAFLAFSFSSFAGTGAPPPIEVIVSLVAENFEVSEAGRAELIAPFEGFSNRVQFRLRGVEVGPGRVMIDFAQGGRPIGSVDLAPEVVATIEPQSPPSAPAPLGGP